MLWLHYAEDMSVRDVAHVIRRTQPHVKVLLFRARLVLKRELERRARLEERLIATSGLAFRNTLAALAGLVARD